MHVFNPFTVMLGAGGLAALVDVAMQSLELRVQGGGVRGGAEACGGDETAGEECVRCCCRMVFRMDFGQWDGQRTARMSMIGVVQGCSSVLLLSAVEAAIGDELSWPAALKKCAVRALMQPVFFVGGAFLIELLRECNLRTFLPKLRQDLPGAMLVTVASLPMYLLIYRLTSSVMWQAILSIGPDVALQLAMNFLLNKRLADNDGDRPFCDISEGGPSAPP
eukprot:GGOE01045375.1.p1 GENE.GGOE01045375.1~~GGOE01045375.1.p1  ORF type:complete len:221 (-),score=59.66 GGOE01045375.1:392-1054(-)